jgi:hypothetical protein
MTLSHVQIHLSPAGSGRSSRIVVDGRDMTNHVQALNVRTEVGKVDEVTLTLRATQLVNISGPAHLRLDPAVADLLVRHGWTPPVERDRTVLVQATEPEADRG